MNKTKIAILFSTLSLIIIALSIGLGVALASQNAQVTANIRVTYTAENISANVSAKYYVETEVDGIFGEGIPLNVYENGAATDATELVFTEDSIETGELSPLNDIFIEYPVDTVVFEYKFVNTSTTNIYFDINLTENFGEDNYNMSVRYAYSDTVVTDFNALNTNASFERQVVEPNADGTRTFYVYAVAKVDEILDNAEFSVDFAWNLARIASYTVTYSGDLEDIILNPEVFTDDIAIEGIPFYTKSTLPQFVESGYCFAGWYTDEDCTKPFQEGSLLNRSIVLYPLFIQGNIPVVNMTLQGGSYVVTTLSTTPVNAQNLAVVRNTVRGILDTAPTGAIVIPDDIGSNRYKVTAITDTLNYDDLYTSLYIGNNVTSVTENLLGYYYDEYAQKNYYNENLTYLYIGKGLKNIPQLAFRGLSAKELYLSNTVNSIGAEAFKGSKIESLFIPTSVNYIDSSAFVGTKYLTKIEVASNNNFYDSRNNCNAIIATATDTLTTGCSTTIIPDTVKAIGDYAFQGNTSLENITIPSSITSIGDYAFVYTGLSSIEIPSNVKELGDSSFRMCLDLTSVTLNEGIKVLGEYAFYDCDSLTNITLPKSLESFGEYAFVDCNNLSSITFKDPEGWAYTVDGIDVYVDFSLPTTNATNLVNIEEGKLGVYGFNKLGYLANYDTTNIVNASDFVSEEISLGDNYYTISTLPIYNKAGYCFAGWFTEPECINRYVEGSVVTGAFKLYPLFIEGNISTTNMTKSGNGYVVTALVATNSSANAIVVPDDIEVDGVRYNVTGISGALNYNDSYKSLYIGNNVSSIPEYITGYAENVGSNTNLNFVYVGMGLKNIPNNAFANTENLREVHISKGVETIGNYAFKNCGLTSLFIPNKVRSIENNSFIGNNFENITVSEINKYYDNRESCNAVIESSSNTLWIGSSNTVIPNDVNKIGKYAFYGTGITTINIPRSVVRIEVEAFNNCTNLNTVTLNEGLSIIGNYAFQNTAISTISIPSSVTEIGIGAFNSTITSQLNSVTFSDTDGWYFVNDNGEKDFTDVTTASTNASQFIANGAWVNEALYKDSGTYTITYTNTSSITNSSVFSQIVLDAGEEYYTVDTLPKYSTAGYCFTGWYTDEACTERYVEGTKIGKNIKLYPQFLKGNIDVANMSLSNGSYTVTTLVANETTDTLVVPDDIEVNSVRYNVTAVTGTLGSSATYKSLYIGNYVTSLASSLCYNNQTLEYAFLGQSVSSIPYQAFRNCVNLADIYFTDSVMSIGSYAFDTCSSLTEIYLPESITLMGNRAFYNCAELVKINIPDAITTLEDSMFELCKKLETVTINNTSKLTAIDNYAFSQCLVLKTLNIPAGVETFGIYVFKECYVIDELVLPEKITIIPTGTFSKCSELTIINIPDKITSIENSVFSGCSALQTVTISNNSELTSIGEFAFNGCSELTSINIPDGVTAINNCAFQKCHKLETVTISDNSKLTSIGDFAFTQCYPLSSINIPNGVVSIGQAAFNDTSLVSVILPDSVTEMGEGVFQKCSKLESVTLHNNLTSLPNFLFNKCSSLKSITIPSSVTTIGTYVFQNCTELTSITIPASVTEIGKNAFYMTIENKLTNIIFEGSTTWYYLNASNQKVYIDLSNANNNVSLFKDGGELVGKRLYSLILISASSQADLANLASVTSGIYSLSSDITLNSTWSAIDISGITILGNGFEIINNSTDTVFNSVTNCDIQALGVVDFEITSGEDSENFGGLVSNATNSLFTNCYAIGSVTGVANVGGLIGECTNCVITGCYSKGSVNGSSYEYFGGLIASANKCTISRSYSTSDVNSSGLASGGLIGSVSYGVTMTDCYATGNVTARMYAMGLISYLWNVDSSYTTKITNCYASGNVKALHVAGLFNVDNRYGKFTFTNCYASGNVISTDTSNNTIRGGRLVRIGQGQSTASNIIATKCYVASTQEYSPTSVLTDKVGETSASLETIWSEMKEVWSSDIWNFQEGSHPTLKEFD